LRCPIEQGEQVFVALKRLGVETEMVRFPEEFHGLSRTGRTDRRITRLSAILGWFERYLK
ncbi:MAG TPA: prolyl oligopeptidase family serine peptidase, partial [Anaerolineales bacterium]